MTGRDFFAGCAAAVAMASFGYSVSHPAPARAQTLAASASRPDGAALFTARCGYCHLPGGTGTMMLERRRGKDKALLAQRSDLQAGYVKAVVRNGLNSMPALTRVEVNDEELGAIAAFIAAPKAKAP